MSIYNMYTARLTRFWLIYKLYTIDLMRFLLVYRFFLEEEKSKSSFFQKLEHIKNPLLKESAEKRVFSLFLKDSNSGIGENE